MCRACGLGLGMLLLGGGGSLARAGERALAADGVVLVQEQVGAGESLEITLRVVPEVHLSALTLMITLSEDLDLVSESSALTVGPVASGSPRSLTVTARSRSGAPARVAGVAVAGWGPAAYHRSFTAENNPPTPEGLDPPADAGGRPG